MSFSKCYAPEGKPVPSEIFYAARDELIEKWNTRSASINTDIDIENSTLDYRVSDDCVIIHTKQGPIIVKREWFKDKVKDIDAAYEESQKSEWIDWMDGYRCDACHVESRYPFSTCPNCKRTMKNGMYDV